jgi:hypothetical protein
MTRFARFSMPLVLLAGSGLAAAADNTVFNMVMPESKVLAGVQVKAALASPLGQRLLSQIQPDAGFAKFVTETGFDPRRDITELLLASPGENEGNSHAQGLAIAKGTFDIERIVAAAKAHGGVTVSTYNGATLLTHDATNEGVIALLDASTAIAGTADYVRKAIDSRSVGNGLDPALLAKAIDVGSRNDIWFATNSPASLGKMPAPGMPNGVNGQMLQAVVQASGGVKFAGSNLQISGEAVMRSDKDATALADVCRFFAGMAQLNSNDPKAAKAADMLKGLDLQTVNNVFKLGLTLSEADIEQFLPAKSSRPAGARRSAQLQRAKP